ncbi:MAG TPA: dihydrolipoamide acetyltransferase family protein [Nocardioides sp.]|nr:dihydrolipoamide acetyltransferase family protein [Nocardioides sp.]
MVDFTMPSLGADMDEGTLLEWLVRPGDAVRKGDVLAVVDTSKSAVEVESFHSGVVGPLLVQPGTTVPVGTPLATILEGAAAAAPVEAPVEVPVEVPVVRSPLVRRDAAQLGVDLGHVHGSGPGGTVTRADVRREAHPHVKVTPYARRLAAELGVDLARVHPADGETVRADDVRGGAATPPAPPPPPSPPPPKAPPTPPADAMRATIAATMTRSKREVPHYYLANAVDLSRALAWMRARNRDLPVARRLVPAALVLHAVARAVAATPALNGFFVDGAFRPGSGVHVGVAISLRGGGLMAPAILDADRLSVEETMQQLKDLVTRTRAGRLRSRELSEPTITVTNLGDQGVDAVYGVIHAPQVALVGVGKVVERPWAADGMVGARPVTEMTLSADHRVTDGFTGARFLALVDEHLQHPEEQ